jgi:hypothetical protein
MTELDPESAQRSLDRFCETVGDARARRIADARTTVGELADAEVLAALPAPYPATLVVERIVTANATLHYRGNRYSVPPGLAGSTLEIHQRLGTSTLEVRSPGGAALCTHHLAHDGAGVVVRDRAHSAALERAVLAQFTTKRPCDKKAHVGVSDVALVHAAQLLGDAGRVVRVDLEDYARLVAS